MTQTTLRDAIAAHIIAQGEARIDDLVTRFAVSRMTIHRHVEQLARQGVLRKLHGGVSAQPSTVYESHFRYRATVAQRQKQALARAALAFVDSGQTVMLDDSTTAGAVAALLPQHAPLTVITNSLNAITDLADADGIDLIALGGQVHRTYNACIGHLCETGIAQLRANVLICSASAISGTAALIQDAQVVRVKQAMFAAATRRILLVDAAKFGKVALTLFADLAAFDAVLVDDALPDATAATLRAAGVPLHLIPLGKP